ncbi:MAG: hypothetical protein RMK29_01770 [Myxococcales bacterium]|nr:hypothetical protein [Myxococcota bacterium]MDW8280408.1 hypothetical protein [Myxococcales bacterium]
MSDHDLRRQAEEIRRALERYDRDQLVEILVHVFRGYVMEGTLPVAPPAVSPPGLDELQGLSFAQVIERLQLRLDLPELAAFEVAGGRVSLRVGGRLVPVEPPGPGASSVRLASPGPAPEPQPVAPAPLAAPAQPSASQASAPASSPPPAVGPVSRAVAPRPPTPLRPAAPPAPAQEPPATDAGGRFTLLEID